MRYKENRMRSLQVPFFDLKRQHSSLKLDLTRVWSGVAGSSDFILGAHLQNFESDFAEFIGTTYAVGVGSGLDALCLSLRVLGIKLGDEVVVPANTFIATALAVSMCGAKPIFVDVKDSDLLLDIEQARSLFSKKTKAVIPVHLYGRPADMKAIRRVCRASRVSVIEDAAQAHGAAIGEERCGSLGDLGCFSFYPSKNLGAFGDGGMITTSQKEFYKKLLSLRNYGSMVKYRHEMQGFNSRLDTLQAGILAVKLKHLNDWNRKRNQIARRYDEQLSAIRKIRLPLKEPGYVHVYHLYVIRAQRRDALKDYLGDQGVGTGIHYPIPIHLQKAYKHLGHIKGDFPVTEKASREVLSLPMYPEMTLEQVDVVCQKIADFYRS